MSIVRLFLIRYAFETQDITLLNTIYVKVPKVGISSLTCAIDQLIIVYNIVVICL